MKTISITVSGKVQGVFYRQSTKEKARELGVKGEVRNLEDGDVNIIATGTDEQLDKLISWCQQGPPRAEVAGINVQELPFCDFDSFRIAG